MADKETLVFVTRTEEGSKQGNSDHYEPAISYVVKIGRFESGTGIDIGEARTMRLNQHYVLEATNDSLGKDSYDRRRFSRISSLPVTDSREEADKVLQEWTRNYVMDICEKTGLRTTLLMQDSRLAEKVGG